MIKLIISAFFFSLSPAVAEEPTARELDAKWNAVFEQMIDLRASVAAAKNIPASPERDALLAQLRERFSALRRNLFTLERKLEILTARQAQENNSRSLDAGRKAARRGAGTSPTGDSPNWTDEADFKESISGQAVRTPGEEEVRPAGKEYWENPDDWKEGLGGPAANPGSRPAPSRLRSPAVPEPAPERVGKGAWENPDDWKSGL